MRPLASKNWQRRFGSFESRLMTTLEAALRAPESKPSLLPFHRSHFNSTLLLTLLRGEVHLYVYETLRRQPRIPNFQRGSGATVRASRNGRVVARGGGPRHRTFT